MRAIFVSSHHEGGNIYTYIFRPERTLHFDAGQFIEVVLKSKNLDQGHDRRWFTISSSPQDEIISVTTRIPLRASIYKHALTRLAKGDGVELVDPLGDFVLPMDRSRRLIFIAGGIGITPFRSIMSDLQARSEKRDVTLIHFARSADDMVFQNVWHRSGIKPLYPDSSLQQQAPKRSRYVIETARPSPDDLIFISGSSSFVTALSSGLIERGIDQQNLVLDNFLGYQ